MDHPLCHKCEWLCKGRYAPLQHHIRNAFPTQHILMLEADHVDQLSDAEVEFRKFWSTRLILKEFDVVQSGSMDDDREHIYLHHSQAELQSIVKSGKCRLCPVIYANLEDKNSAPYARSVVLTMDRDLDWRKKESFSLNFHFLKGPQKTSEASDPLLENSSLSTGSRVAPQWSGESVFLQAWKLPYRHDLSANRSFCGGIGDYTHRRIRKWLDNCMSNHSKCVSQVPLSLPARLVKIGEDPAQTKIKLVSTKDLTSSGFKPRYAALSHCWGPDGVSNKLLKDSVLDWQEDIPMHLLSKTFREAINFSLSLGITHIWIDALCIIQDSSEDWNHEAPLMGAIYSHSTVTIAATASEDGDGGLLVQGHAGPEPSCEVDLNIRGPQATRGRWEVRVRDADDLTYPKLILASPLNIRAWCYQEYKLSQRIVHFTSSEVWWQCQEGSDKEISDQDGVDHALERDGLDEPGRGGWDGIIATYSNKHLTFPGDRLIALAGVAGQFASQCERLPSDYLAGLWRSELKTQLLWTIPTDFQWYSRPIAPIDRSVAPSWSWASHTGAVAFISSSAIAGDWNPAYEVVHVETQLKSSGPFGAVDGGACRLRSVVVDIQKLNVPELMVGLNFTDDRPNMQGYLQSFDNCRCSAASHSISCISQYKPTHALPLSQGRGHFRESERGFQVMLLRQIELYRYIRIDLIAVVCLGETPKWWFRDEDVREIEIV